MSDQEILDTLTGILRDLLMDNTVVLTMETQRQDVPDWDSLMYINFIVGAEVEFAIKFSIADVESFLSVGEIVTKIRKMQS